MKLSLSTRKRFIKDFSLPIPVVDSPYFEYFIDLYDELLQTKQKLQSFKGLIAALESEQSYYQLFKSLTEEVIETIKNQPSYKDFQNFDMKAYEPQRSYPEHNLYTMKNSGDTFVSIDMCKANFQCMRLLDPALVLNATSYENFISKFTPHKYFAQSKQIRQVIFGNLNPKRQQKLQKFAMSNLYSDLLNHFDESQLAAASSDELVFRIPPSAQKRTLDLVCQIVPVNLQLNVKTFTLHSIGSRDLFKKVFSNGSVEYKNVPAHFFAEVYKFDKGLPVTEMDRVTLFENRLVKFIGGLFDQVNLDTE